MTGLDTNVILRYLTQDDAAQSRMATKCIDSLSAEDPGFVALVVLAEIAWVLQTSYHSSREEIARVIESLLRTKSFVIEKAEIVWSALRMYSVGRADFSDCLVERCANAAGCESTVTFDQIAAASAGMRLLK